jgi:CO/xanthine dehydrogenase FAD-binding subunit
MFDMGYERPRSVAAACTLLGEMRERAVVLAGGTDLQLKLRARMIDPALIVDIKAIAELSEIVWRTSGELWIGSTVTMRQIYEDRRLAETYPGLALGAEAVGSLQIRCRATIGGNLCNASPCMDTAPGLLVLGARVKAASATGERDIPIDGFFAGVKKTLLVPGELCTAIVVPAASQRLRTAFGKVKRVRGHDLALVNAAAALDPDAGMIRAAVGSCGQTPVLTPPMAISGGAREVGERLAAAAVEVIRPIDDVRASAEYRRDMAALLCRRLAAGLLAPAAGRAS